MKCAVLAAACFVVVSVGARSPARADPVGVRDALAERVFQYGFKYTGDAFDVTSGGMSRGGSLNGLLEGFATVDLAKTLGWQGATFHINGYEIHGKGPSAKHAANILTVSNAEALATVRLFEIWIEQSELDGKLKIRAGQLGADSDFFISDTAAVFLNGTFGWPGIVGSNMTQGGPAYPLATPGVRIAYTPNESLTLLAGLFNGSPADPAAANAERANRHGTNFRLSDPPLLMTEAQFKYDAGLPGVVKLGGWKQFGDFADQRTGGAITGDYGLYAIVDQQIWAGGANEKISVFGRVSGSPDRQNLIDVYFDAGIVASGVVPGRAKDSFGAAFGYGRISDRARAADKDAALPVIRDYEAVLEVNYTAEIMPGWQVVPDFQYVWHPGGNVENPLKPGTAVENAVVFGVRTTLSY
jgi:porin